MNLLSSQNNSGEKIKQAIFDALYDVDIMPEEMKIAENFFDVSNELDTSLLENIKSREFKNNNCDRFKRVYELVEKHKSDVYFDRLILFLDALMGNLILKCLSSFSHIISNNELRERIARAYGQRYSDDIVQAKICAIFAEAYKEYISEPKLLSDMAKESPETFYTAFKTCCVSSDALAKLKLCALALSGSLEKGAGSLSSKHAKEMSDFIVRAFNSNKGNLSSDYIFDKLMSQMFMAIYFDKHIEEMIKKHIFGREIDFLIAMFENVTDSYFEANLKKIDSIIGMGRRESFTINYIETAVIYAWAFNNSINKSEKKAKIFLKYCAENYPKQIVEVMYSENEIGGNFQPRSNMMWYIIQDMCYCCYYGNLYTLLKESNPKALSDYNINFNDDILKLVIKTELIQTDIAKSEIKKYLLGEADLSVLEPYYDKLANNFNGKYFHSNNRIVNICKNIFPEFTGRLFCLKAIQFPEYVVKYILNYCGPVDEKYDAFKALIVNLNKGGVPVEYRFGIYGDIINYSANTVKANITDFVLQSMIDRKDKQDGEYKSYCPSGSVFARKVYASYLINTNDERNANREEIIKLFGDSSKEVREALVEALSEHKEFESDVIELLKAKKAAVRETAVNILISWGAENYKATLLEAADQEKSYKIANKIRDALSVAKPGSGEKKINSPMDLVDELHKGGRNKKILWLYSTPFPTVHFKSGDEANDKYVQAIMLCYSGMTEFGISDKANVLAEQLNEDELKRFVSEVLSKWLSDGAESKKKWVLNFAAIHGGIDIIDVFLHYIKEWSENMRGAIAAEAVKALAMNGSSQALMAIDNMAHKFKQKQVKNAAVQALESAADALGITSDELADRIVPDLGFDENMRRIFDYGTRKFKVYLTSSLELEIFDENDKKLKNIPAPGKRDDEEIAKKSNAEFRSMKKQLKNVISIQKMRLETAVLADRRWDKLAWEKLFVKNPVMHSFAIGLVWASYEDGKLLQTFRYMEDGTFNTADEDEYELPETAVIGLVHPIDLDDKTLSAWKEQLEDYEIIQPIEQLNRPVYRIKNDEIGKLDLERFDGREINGMSLLGRTSKYGWQKGPVLDAGGFAAFYREDVTKRIKSEDGTVVLEGSAVELNFDGMYVGGEDRDVKIEKVRFYKPGTVSFHADDDKAIKLDEISPRYFSEIIYQLEAITKTAEKKE